MNSNLPSNRIGFGPRLGAFLIDSFLMAFLASLLMSLFMPDQLKLFADGKYLEVLAHGTAGDGSMESILKVSSFLAHFSMLYMLIEGFVGATPGKLLLGMKIGTPEGYHGDQKLYMTRYLVKNSPSLLNLAATTLNLGLFAGLSGIAGMVILMGGFMMLSPDRQALHDRVAHTAIFKRVDLRERTSSAT